MYDYLNGKIEEVKPHYVIIEVQQIGYRVQVPVRHTARLKEGETQKLFTALLFREPEMNLYGFVTAQERDLFLSLLSVSGVGPKLALALIGHLSIEDFHDLAIHEDASKLKLVPGVGKRTAERLLVELKAKFEKGLPQELRGVTVSKELPSHQSSEAIDALISLGYQVKDAQRAVSNVLSESDAKMSTSAIVTKALQNGLK